MDFGNFSILPIEIVIKIYSYLNVQHLRSVRLASKAFKEFIDNDIKFMERIIVKISDENVKEIRDSMEKPNFNTCIFKNLQILEIEKGQEDLNYITEKIGETTQHLVIDNKKAFDNLKGNLKNLKSLEIRSTFIWHKDIRLDLWDEGSYNLSELPLLEDLNLQVGENATNGFLTNLEKNPNSLLKRLKLKAESDNKLLINVLNLHTTIEDLNIKIKKLPENNADYITLWKEVFANLKNLRNISLHQENFINIVLENIPKDTPLKKLELSKAKSDMLLSLISKKWKNSLHSLSLNCCTLNDVDLMELNKLVKLRVLDIYVCFGDNISRGLLHGIAAKPTFQLAELHLTILTNFKESELNSILSRLRNLRVLVLDDYTTNVVTNNTLACIFRNRVRLRILKIKKSTIITDEAFNGFGDDPYSIGRLRELEEFMLDYCPNLTDQTLSAFKCSHLRKLTLKDVRRITSEGIKQLVKKCPLLESLGVSNHNLPDPVELKFIGDELKCLRNLIVYFTIVCIDRENEMKRYLKYLRKGISLFFSPKRVIGL